MPKDLDKKHKSFLDKKWDVLEKRGLTRPKDSAENRKRAKEAHGY